MATYQFRGEVWDRSSKLPLGGVRVEALDVRGRVTDVVAVGVSDAQGRVELSVTDALVKEIFEDNPPILYFRMSMFISTVLSVIGTTEKTHRWNALRNASGRLEVDSTRPIVASGAPQYVVEGIVVDMPGGAPRSGATVTVHRRVLRGASFNEELLGTSAATAANGRYRVVYNPHALNTETFTPDVIVRAMVSSVEVAKATFERVGPKLKADLLIAGTVNEKWPGPTRFAEVDAKVSATGTSLQWQNLTATHVSYMAGQSALDSTVVQELVNAKTLNTLITTVPAEQLYAFTSRGIAGTQDALFSHRLPTLQRMLENAIADRVITTPAIGVPATMTNLQTAGRAALRLTGGGKLRLGTLIDSAPGALITGTHRDAFLNKALNHETTTEEFWASVDNDAAFDSTGDQVRRRFRFAVEAAAITGFYQPVVQQLHTRISSSTLVDDPRELAKYTAADWDSVLLTAVADAPVGTPGANAAARKVNYRNQMLANAEARYRSVRIKARVSQGEASTSPLRKFFEASVNITANFEFERHRVGSYLIVNNTALDTLTLQADKDEAVRRLKNIERLFVITDTWDEISALEGANLVSSHAIHQLGAEGLALQLPSLVNASLIYQKACWRSTSSAVVRSKYSSSPSQKAMKMFADKATLASPLPAKLADWATLFGSADQCACKHCRSVLSPAAYLVDSLEMLERVTGNAKTTLLNRRPDLKKLALSCETATTPMPYIDIVNEIMEVRLASATWPSWPSLPARIDSLQKPDEYSAHPELLYPVEHIAAYTALELAVHPFQAPFHLWQEEARVYLDHLGVSRDALLELLGPITGGPNALHLALERLRITQKQFNIIAGPPIPAQAGDYWGLPPAGWPAALASAKTVMEKAGLTFDELREILMTKNFAGSTVFFAGSPPPCDLGSLTITGMDANKASHLHRLLRLRRALGFSITETDLVWGERPAWGLTAPVVIDAAALQNIAGLKSLVARLGVTPRVALSFYGPIDCANKWEQSLFEKLFLSRKLQSPALEVFNTVFANGLGTGSASTIANVQTGIAAALEITSNDLKFLTDATAVANEAALPPLVPSTTAVTNSSLSQLHRVTALSKAIGRSVRDTVILREFSGINALQDVGGTTATPALTLNFLSQLDRFEQTGLTVDELHYALRHVTTPERGLELTATQVSEHDAALVGDVAKIADEARQVVDPDGQLLLSLGALLLKPTELDLTKQLGDGTLGSSAAESLIDGALAPFIGDTVEARAQLVTSGTKLTDVSLRRAFIIQRLSRYLACRGAALEWVSRTFDLPSDVSAILMGTTPEENSNSISILDPGTGAPLVRRLIPSESDTRWARPTADASERAQIMQRLQKVALLIRRLRLSAQDLYTLRQLSLTLPAVDFANLPISRPASAAMDSLERGRFTQLLRLADYVWLRDRYPAGASALNTFLVSAQGMTLSAIYDRLATETRFDRADIAALAVQLGGSPTPVSFAGEALLVRILRAMESLGRLGASADQAVGWLAVESGVPASFTAAGPNALTIAREIKSVARARHSEESWNSVARGIRDPLREKQRAALVAALLPKTTVANADRLFENLLIDVEMSPCAITSRMVAAHGSLQMFTNRIQLNLEPAHAPSKQLAREWEWMHAYRLWEANRKVFLWPENWIEPELRTDKTPLFEDLETALLQGPLSRETVERAYRGYLDGLAEIGNLEIVSMHTESLLRVNMTHVIGRTPAPHRYFYRKRDSMGWTPWEKIDLDIQGEHILPVVYGSKLYLFWLSVEDVPKPGQPTDSEAPAQIAATVRLSVGEKQDGGWALLGASEPVTMGASPARETMSLSHALQPAEIEVNVLVLRSRAAKFSFDPGTRRIRGNPVGTVVGVDYSSKTVAVVAPWGEPFIDNPNFVVNFLGLSSAFFQWFDRGEVRGYLSNGGDPIPNALVLSTVPGGAKIAVNRGPANGSRELRHMIVQDPRRSFYLHLRFYQTLTTGTKWPKYGGAETGHFPPEPEPSASKKYSVTPFFHPYVESFRTTLAVRGIDGLLKPQASAGTKPQDLSEDVASQYGGASQPHIGEFQKLSVDFRNKSPYGEYNWELFFHAPFLIANRLHQDGRFAEARQWYHAIFDPTDGAAVPGTNKHTRYWKFKPFAENTDLATIQAELNTVAVSSYAKEMLAWADAQTSTEGAESFIEQIALWRNDPFDPHAIAKVRILAYQKAVVQKYIENLLAWGDHLFSQDTMESVNEAAQLYIHALQLLGPKPTLITAPADAVKSYEELGGSVDVFGNVLTEVEVIVPPMPADFVCKVGALIPVTVAGSTYFCVPENERLFGYWDTIADRLFKLRHCQNIEGVVRTLPLFQPPIDPALLVRARAAGLDLASVLNDLSVSGPPYRYSTLIARAMEYTGAVQGLGASLLSAIEKQDGEELAQLRAGHDVANQQLSRQIRKDQLKEARENLLVTQRSLKSAEARLEYYDSREFMSPAENVAMGLGGVSEVLSLAANVTKLTASSTASGAPDFGTGGAGVSSPLMVAIYGSTNVSAGASAAADALDMVAQATNRVAADTATRASYGRRMDDWEFQARQAKLEIAQIEKQIVAAEIRVAMAEQELGLIEQQARQSKEVDAHLRSKFTNKQLYGWMKGQLFAVHNQAYRLAYDMARRAEKAFQHERADSSQVFIKFGAWDGAKQGLLSGEKLAMDLRRMDAAYHTQNRREHELTKTISVAQLNPEAFMALREGEALGAAFSLSEKLFDDDFPTHHLRRLKTVNITLQCSPGPYQSVSGSLELLQSETRLESSAATATADTRVAHIATSTAQNDAGVFELNFRDERYLPFEYRGAHWDGSGPQWRFRLTGGNEFPYDSISDLVLQLRYTAREGRSGAPPPNMSPKRALIRVSQTHADAWAAYKETPATGIGVATKPSLFPRGKTSLGAPRTVTITKVKALYKWSGSAGTLRLGGVDATPVPTDLIGTYTWFEWTITGTDAATWMFTTTGGTLSDLFVAFTYTIGPT